MNKTTFIFILITIVFPFTTAVNSVFALPAFPGAEGFGAETVGGRGGTVFLVTNLNDSGEGSLREALEASGPRIVVFRTGGTITTNSTITISSPYITIAGQTAPGGGITIKSPGHTGIRIATHDVIIRYITIRNGSGGETESLAIYKYGGDCYNILIDHCSLSWATDEVAQTWYKSHDITFSWNIISEGLDCSTHSEGCHSKGLMFGSDDSEDFSIHHNLLAHNIERNPIIQIDNTGSGKFDVINNVYYNAKGNPTLIWERYGGPISGNFIGNYHKLGVNSVNDERTIRLYCDDGNCSYSVYLQDNLSNLRQNDEQNENLIARVDSGVNSNWAIDNRITTSEIPITSTNAIQAYNDVLEPGGAGNSKMVNCAGNWANRRDSIDSRVIEETKSGSAFRGSLGSVIDDESEVGGWVTIEKGSACSDTDNDGMPDDFESSIGSNRYVADAAEDINADGYSNIEDYINGTASNASSTSPDTVPSPTRLRIAESF